MPFDVDAELAKILAPPKQFQTPNLINYLRKRRALIAPKISPLEPLTTQEPFRAKRAPRGLVYPGVKPAERKKLYPFLGKEYKG